MVQVRCMPSWNQWHRRKRPRKAHLWTWGCSEWCWGTSLACRRRRTGWNRKEARRPVRQWTKCRSSKTAAHTARSPVRRSRECLESRRRFSCPRLLAQNQNRIISVHLGILNALVWVTRPIEVTLPSRLLELSKMFCGFISRWATLLLCK